MILYYDFDCIGLLLMILQYGFTVLMVASKSGHIDTVKILLSVPRIDANMKNNVRNVSVIFFSIMIIVLVCM